MGAFAATLAMAAPLLVADEKSFFHVPEVEDFRVQKVARADRESEWPFTVDAGYLTCAYVLGESTVYFTDDPQDATDLSDVRVVIVSTNPLDLIVGRLAGDGLIGAETPIEQLIVQMAPFKAIGNRLCAQPRGTSIGPGEL